MQIAPDTVIVVGAGASGMMAAGKAAEMGARVLLLEKTDLPGKKILISGKTRCNLTNARELEDFISMYGRNGRFLYRAFHTFFREDLLGFFQRYGLETKIERGGRIFPVSDRACDVLEVFRRYMADYGVALKTSIKVHGIHIQDRRVNGVHTDKELLRAGAVILATGGATWPSTGSTGDGYRIAKALGHAVTKLRPALVPLVVDEVERAQALQGVSLRNVRLTAFRSDARDIDDTWTPSYDAGRGIRGKKLHRSIIESRMGEMIFTHFGIGGPITLLMSLAVVDALEEGPVSTAIDLKPALSRDQLRERLQRDLDRFGKRSTHHILEGLLPRKMVTPCLEMTGLAPDKPANQVSASERDRLADLLKSLRFTIKSPLPMSSAIVTAGGVSLKEIDPRTMASRLVPGLYFCGEIMDIDADTGGYNLQAAFSTGYVAGAAAAAYVQAQGGESQTT